MSQRVDSPEADMSEAARKRHAMVACNIERLQHFAYRAKCVLGKSNEDVVVVCIQVDSDWRPLVDALMPNTNWQKFRDLGQEPIARGTALFSICEVVAKRMPEIADVLMEKPGDGLYKCIALDDGGCTVYEIEPVEQTE